MQAALEPEWQVVIGRLKLDNFETAWNLPLDIVDEPNRARGGSSEVGRYALDEEIAGARSIYIKRQHNFTYRPLNRLWSRRPVCEREYYNLKWCEQHGVPAVRPLLYMQDTSSGGNRAILITAGLDNYVPLSVIEKEAKLPFAIRRVIIRQTAGLVAHMHHQGLVHTCLYSKHIYVSKDALDKGEGDIRLIDLEKGRALSAWGSNIFRDLDSLNRHAVNWGLRDRLSFLRHYLGDDQSTFRALFNRLDSSYQNWI